VVNTVLIWAILLMIKKSIAMFLFLGSGADLRSFFPYKYWSKSLKIIRYVQDIIYFNIITFIKSLSQ
jgi:hypothetical protein